MLALLAVPAAAAEFNPLGDGSGFDNADLVRDPTTGCENCAGAAPHEWGAPPFDLDWSLALRGAVIEDGSGTRFQAIALPSVSLTHRTLRGGYSLGADAEIDYNVGGSARVGSLGVEGSADYQLDAVTTAGLKGSLGLSQDDPDGPGYAPNVAAAPLVVEGQGEASLTRDFGTFLAALRANAGRSVHGDTLYDDNSTSSNAFQNLSNAGAGGRLGLRLGPVLTGFIDTEAAWEGYDEVSPSLLVRLDNFTYAARSGLTAKFGEVIQLEGSLGLGYRDFADGTLSDFSAVLYDARAVFRPDETLALTGTFTTTISTPGTTSGATAKIAYAASGEASYQVNPWLRLRGSATWSEAHFAGIASDEYKWGFGTGADYLLNEHMDLTADYTFARTQTTPDPAEDEQRLTLGLTFRR